MSVLPVDPESIAIAQLRLGGVLLPGIIEPGGIAGWARKTKFKETPAKGSDGASMELEGDENPSGKVVLTMWDPEQLIEWAEAYTTLRAAREAGSALDILQPIVNALEVTSVVVESIGQLTYEAGGKWTVELGLKQWLPAPKKAPAKPSGSAADKNGGGSPEGGGPGTAATEQTAAEKELADLADQAANT